MNTFWTALPFLFFLVNVVCGGELLFRDQFDHKLGEGWTWVREHPGAWRVGHENLEVRIEPGNMWGPQNDAKNLLTRPAPAVTNAEIEISVRFANKPSHQYEQADLVWYHDDSNMVKLGHELVDGKISVVMGREEKDQTKTIAVIPIDSPVVHLRMRAKGNRLRGQFRIQEGDPWRDAGECEMPAATGTQPRICLQFYQGPEKEEHWARVTDFKIVRNP